MLLINGWIIVNDYSEIQDENSALYQLPQMEAMPLSLLKVFVQTPRIVFPFKQLVFLTMIKSC